MSAHRPHTSDYEDESETTIGLNLKLGLPGNNLKIDLGNGTFKRRHKRKFPMTEKVEEQHIVNERSSNNRKDIAGGAAVGGISGGLTGAGVGGATGAGIGAVVGGFVGSIVPGPGTAVGLAVGAAIGGGIGATAGGASGGGAGIGIGATLVHLLKRRHGR